LLRDGTRLGSRDGLADSQTLSHMKKFITFIALCVTAFAQLPPPPGGDPNNAGGVNYNVGAGRELKITYEINGTFIGGGTVQQSGEQIFGPGSSGAYMNGTDFEHNVYSSLTMSYASYVRTVPASGETKVGASWIADGGVAEPTAWEPFLSGNVDKQDATAYQPELNVAGVPLPNHSVTPDESKTLWETDDTTLTANLFREGIDKVVASSGGSGGGTSTDAMTYAQFNASDASAHQALGLNYAQNQPTSQVLNAETNAAKTAITNALTAKATPTYGDGASGGNSIMVITLGNTGKTLNLDPASYPTFAAYASFLKACIAWLAATLFGFYLWNWCKELYLVLAGTMPAKGNTVAGSGGQVTSLVVAIAITAIMISFPVAFWTMADSGYTWAPSLTQNPLQLVGASNLGAMGAMGLYLFNFFMPVGTLLACLTSYLIVLRGGLVLVAVLQTGIRYIVA